MLGRLGLPVWFRKTYFANHAAVRLTLKLSCGLGQPCTQDVGIPQGCHLSMIFIVAMCLPWCGYLEAVLGVSQQLYADSLKCVSSSPEAFLSAARFTNLYIGLVGHLGSVLLSTSRSVRIHLASWLVTGAGDTWTVKLDVRDLGGHVDLTYRERATTLCRTVGGILCRAPVVYALPWDCKGQTLDSSYYVYPSCSGQR